MFKKIMKCDYVFDPPWWDDVTDNAKVRCPLASTYLSTFLQMAAGTFLCACVHA